MDNLHDDTIRVTDVTERFFNFCTGYDTLVQNKRKGRVKMKRNTKKSLLWAAVSALAFALWTVLIQTADVRAVGQNGTDIGFATLNKWFFNLTGVHMTLYTVTDWLGLVPIAVCLGFGAVGFIQLVKRKSLIRVDRDITLLGVYYIIVIFCYLIFEKVPINYRPILIDGRIEASYPSSTTLLVLSVMPTLVFQARRRVKKPVIRKTAVVAALLFSVFTVIGRLISGVHWLTDIIGGALIGAALFNLYKSAVLMCDE